MESFFKPAGMDTVKTADILIPKRLRDIDETYVDAIRTSIEQQGQLQPIEVALNPRKGKDKKPYVLIAGAHRLAACTKLERDVLASIVKYKRLSLHDFEAACHLREIDENLIRHDLAPLDRAVFLHSRKQAYEELYPETKHGGKLGTGPQNSKDETISSLSNTPTNEMISFADSTSELIGLTGRTIQLACRIAENIPVEHRDLIRSMDIFKKQNELLKLANYGPDIQKKLIAKLSEDDSPAKSVDAAIQMISGKAPDKEADDAGFKKLTSAWRQARKKDQDKFIEYLRETRVIEGAE